MALTITPGAYKLVNINGEKTACECCDRALTVRTFTVRHATTGATLKLGRRCAANATGYRPNDVERQARIAERTAELARRREILAAEYPDLAAEYAEFLARLEDAQRGGRDGSSLPRSKSCHAFQAAMAADRLWDGRNRTGYVTRDEFIAQWLRH